MEQFWNPYAYAGNGTNLVLFVDPDGNLLDPFSWAIIIGAVAGAYAVGSMANGTRDLTKWNYSSGKT